MNAKYADFLKKKAAELIAVPHCYADLKEKGKKWLESLDTPEEKEAAKKFVEELKADVLTIDNLIEFSQSDMAKQKFGEESCKKMHDNAVEAKAKGEKYCVCPACKAGGEILDMSQYLLE